MKPALPVNEVPGTRPVIFAKDQPQYSPLPALVSVEGDVYTEWKLEAEELALLFSGGRVRLRILTLNHPLQPVMLEVVPGAPE